MIDLAELLGHRALSDSLLSTLGARGTRCWLKGPSGSGKTALARVIADHWAARSGDVHWLAGERDETTTGHAAYRALKAGDPHRAIRKVVQDEAPAPLMDVPVVGNTLAALARVLISRFETQGPDFLTSEQQDLLAGFERASLSESVLFVVDDTHLLDPGTARLLQLMQQADVAAGYSFIRRASFLFVEATDQSARLAPDVLNALRDSASKNFSVQFPAWDVYPDILTALGLRRPLDTRTSRSLYNLTRGHLKLAREIVRLVSDSGLDPAISASSQISTVDELAAALLRARLSSLPQAPGDLERLLAIAACLGKSFSRRELECAFDQPQSFLSALDLAQREEYITGDSDALQFTHEIVQAALRHLETPEATVYHDRLAECIRHLRPGDYMRRYAHSVRTVNTARTAELLLSAWLQEARGEAIAVPNNGLNDTSIGELTTVLVAARNALKAMDEGRHTEAVRLLIPFYDGAKTLAQGEIAYLLALNYYKGRSTADYESARAILEPWISRRDEGELWFRLMMTLAVVHASVDDRRSATDVLRRVRTYLDRMAAYDPTARTKIQVLNRKAEIFFPVEIAGQLIRSAVEYFAPSQASRVPRNAFQYSSALVNLSGNLYVRGEFIAAAETADRAIRCLAELSGSIRLVEPYKAFNNYAIAAFRSGQISAMHAVEILGAVLGPAMDVYKLDRSLVATNLGAMRLLAGDIDGGRDLLERTYTRLKDDEVDGYYLLFASSNLAVAHHLSGQAGPAHQLLDATEQYLRDIPSEFLTCAKKRLHALREAFANPNCRDVVSLDRFPRLSVGEDGPHIAWRSFGWGLIMSDIQVWSES